jgi:hypothetical protein
MQGATGSNMGRIVTTLHAAERSGLDIARDQTGTSTKPAQDIWDPSRIQASAELPKPVPISDGTQYAVLDEDSRIL